MKKDIIKLNNETSMDLLKFRSQMSLLQASTGGGKSWAIRRILEQSFGKIPHIILDTEGEFATLREKYDYILIGKGYEIAADPKTAHLMALRLWEEGVSAIIDLYELTPWDRALFVKNFVNAMINAPKKLWNPVLLVIDEAHEYAPEGDRTESGRALHLLASKGRKRQIGVIFATQRIATLSKNVVAACKNKLIGYTSLMNDMKRAADELGFNKEEMISLRKLDPGEFFAFGPAISKDIIKARIGEVLTTHGSDQKTVGKVAPASDKVKKALAKLADLPQEMKNEEDLIQSLKNKITNLEIENREMRSHPLIQTTDPKDTEKQISQALQKRDKQWETVLKGWMNHVQKLTSFIEKARNMFITANFSSELKDAPDRLDGNFHIPVIKKREIPKVEDVRGDRLHAEILQNGFKTEYTGEQKFGKCSKLIASYLYNARESRTKTQVAVATGYSQGSGGFNNSISELSAAGIIKRDAGNLSFIGGTLGPELYEQVDLSLEKWLPKFGACPRAIWTFMLENVLPSNPDGVVSKETIAEATNYSPGSGGFNNSLSQLSALGLIERAQGGIRINPEVLHL